MALAKLMLCAGLLAAHAAQGQQAAKPPLPAIPELMRQVQEHQKQLEKVRENYTFTSDGTTQDIDGNGQVKKTETEESDAFYVHGHLIERLVKKNGQSLSERDQQKETERVTKLVEKAQNTPPDQSLQGPTISVSRLLQIMDVRNPRRETYRGRPTIVFDFAGRKDAKTHGLAEDMSKKLDGTMWIDENDRQVAHVDVRFEGNFRIGGGLLATIQKGTQFSFDQAPVHDSKDGPLRGSQRDTSSELWMPTGAEGSVQARLLLLKGVRQRFTERDFDYKVFRVEAQPAASASPDQKHAREQ